jgi:hypothetical protein
MEVNVVCTLKRTLFGCSTQGGRTEEARVRGECIQDPCEDLKGRCHLDTLVVDGRIILEW